jgi:hypothetical protein
MRSAPGETQPTARLLSAGGRWGVPAAAAVASTVVFVLVRGQLIDDAFITFSYAKNLAFHGHWGLIEQGTANTATSPLNVFALATLTVVLRDTVLAAGVLFVVCQVLFVLALRRLGEHAGLPAWFAPLATGLLLVNPLLLSSVGLEVVLGAAGVAWLLVFSVERRPVAFGVAVGLLAMIRLDLLLLAAVVFFARRTFWEGIWRSLFAALAVALPWFTFSWVVLGSAVPDTLIIKTLQRSWGPWSFANGPLVYWRHFPEATVLSFLPVLLAGVGGVLWLVALRRGSDAARRLTPFAALAAAGGLHYAAYGWLTVPPYHWYYGPGIICATIFVSAGIALVGEHYRVGATAALVLTAAAALGAYLVPGAPPITTNHATSAQYEAIGKQVAVIAAGRTVHSAGEIGALAYYCGCPIVDQFSDRGTVEPEIEASKDRTGDVGKAFIDANFRFFDQSVAPMTADLILGETAGTPPPNALAVWPISSPWTGRQRLFLVNA